MINSILRIFSAGNVALPFYRYGVASLYLLGLVPGDFVFAILVKAFLALIGFTFFGVFVFDFYFLFFREFRFQYGKLALFSSERVLLFIVFSIYNVYTNSVSRFLKLSKQNLASTQRLFRF